jgi:hypothetical protein
MTATNHAVTGALVATAIGNPWLALPAALISHFVIDCFPHWDYYKFIRDPSLRRIAPAVDILLGIGLLLAVSMAVQAPFWLAFAGGLIGIIPDTMWLSFILKGNESIKGNINSPLNRVRRLHLRIQWLETPKLWGLLAEIIWLAVTLVLITKITS